MKRPGCLCGRLHCEVCSEYARYRVHYRSGDTTELCTEHFICFDPVPVTRIELLTDEREDLGIHSVQ